jgi:hypothetical protein
MLQNSATRVGNGLVFQEKNGAIIRCALETMYVMMGFILLTVMLFNVLILKIINL